MGNHKQTLMEMENLKQLLIGQAGYFLSPEKKYVWLAALLSFALGLSNSLALSSYRVEAFYVGAIIGTLIFLRIWKIPRFAGAIFLLWTVSWCYLMQLMGALDLLERM